jgi:hypothetical protein
LKPALNARTSWNAWFAIASSRESKCKIASSLVAQKRRTVGVNFCAEFLERGALEANVPDKRMSSDVKQVGLLAKEMMWSLTAVDCSWYFMEDGTVFQRPMSKMIAVGSRAARAIVGTDIRIDCVLNQASSKLKCLADDFRAVWMVLYKRQWRAWLSRKDRNGSEPCRFEVVAHRLA